MCSPCSACDDDRAETPVSAVEFGTWCVPVIFRGQDNFIVPNVTRAEAERIAREKFSGGDQPDECGNEWQEIEQIGEIEAVI